MYDWSTHPFGEDSDFQEEFDNAVNNPEVKEAELFTPDTYDQYIQMELALPQIDSQEPQLARVTRQLKDANGISIGTADQTLGSYLPVPTQICGTDWLLSLTALSITNMYSAMWTNYWPLVMMHKTY